MLVAMALLNLLGDMWDAVVQELIWSGITEQNRLISEENMDLRNELLVAQEINIRLNQELNSLVGRHVMYRNALFDIMRQETHWQDRYRDYFEDEWVFLHEFFPEVLYGEDRARLMRIDRGEMDGDTTETESETFLTESDVEEMFGPNATP